MEEGFTGLKWIDKSSLPVLINLCKNQVKNKRFDTPKVNRKEVLSVRTWLESKKYSSEHITNFRYLDRLVHFSFFFFKRWGGGHNIYLIF